MPISNSREKFVHELADVYDAEHQFLDAMQKMMEQMLEHEAAEQEMEHAR